jgi:serine/threonine protein kinase
MKKLFHPAIFYQAAVNRDVYTISPSLTQIGSFKLKNEIEKKGSFVKFAIGEYINTKDGKRVFGKTLIQHIRFNVLSLSNEALMYELLHEVQKSVNHRIPRAIKNIRIPHSYGLRKKRGVLSLFIEYIEGIPLVTFPTSYQFKTYENVVSYIRYLGDNMTHEQKDQIGKRYPLIEIFMFPFLVVVAAFSYPKILNTLLRGVSCFYLNVFNYIKDQRLVLTHRDLHAKNILIQEKTVYIIDLENMVFTHPDYEYVVSFLACWRNKELSERIWSLVQNKHIGKLLLIKMATHYLTHRNLTQKKYDDYTEALNWAINTKI